MVNFNIIRMFQHWPQLESYLVDKLIKHKCIVILPEWFSTKQHLLDTEKLDHVILQNILTFFPLNITVNNSFFNNKKYSFAGACKYPYLVVRRMNHGAVTRSGRDVTLWSRHISTR